jgi:hypothetical protein
MKEYHMPDFGLTIQGTRGKMKVDDDEVNLVLNGGESHKWYRHDLNDSVDFLLGAPEYFREDEFFIKSVMEKSNTGPNFRTSAKVDDILDQVRYRASECIH